MDSSGIRCVIGFGRLVEGRAWGGACGVSGRSIYSRAPISRGNGLLHRVAFILSITFCARTVIGLSDCRVEDSKQQILGF